MGASRPPLSASQTPPGGPGWACTTILSPCLLAGAELTSHLSKKEVLKIPG